MSEKLLKHEYPTIPVRDIVLFPQLVIPLNVGRDASVAALEAAMASEDKTLVIASQKDPLEEQVDRDSLHEYGTIAVVKKAEKRDGFEHTALRIRGPAQMGRRARAAGHGDPR